MERMLYTYGALVVIGWIGFAGYELIDWRCLTATEWAAWVGAIGTILAFAGTIWIATTDRRERIRNEQARAVIRGCDILIRMAACKTRYLAFIKIMHDPEVAQDRAIKIIAHQLASMPMWSVVDIEGLICVPNLVARDVTQILKGYDTLQFTCNAYGSGQQKAENISHGFGKIQLQLRVACNQIDAVNENLKKFLSEKGGLQF